MFIMLYYFYTKNNFEFSFKIRKPDQVILEGVFNIQSIRSNFSNITLDEVLLSRSIQDGNSDRLRHVLKKALRGENINMLVIGGSHSAGGKLGLDENSLDGLYYKVFAKWWNDTFGNVTKSFLKVIPLPIGGTESYFFAFCYKTFIPEGENIDIVLIETSANDQRLGTVKPLEHLTRQVLTYISAPVVLYINVVHDFGVNPVTKTVQNPSCNSLEDFGQKELAGHYGITLISLREIICRKEKGRWKVVFTDMAGSDGKHIGVEAHAHIAMMMMEYVRRVYEEIDYDVTEIHPHSVYRDSNLPKLLFIKRETEALKNPLCWTGKTPNVFKNLHHSNLKLEIIENTAFSPCFKLYHQKPNVKRVARELRTDSQGGWCAWKRSSTLKLKIYVPLIAGDNSFRSRSVTVLTTTRHEGGEAKVWLDNEINKAIRTNSTWINDRYETIGTRVKPGYHTITVRTLHNRMFMVTGVLVGAPDFQIKYQ